jgi:hypothetical protein
VLQQSVLAATRVHRRPSLLDSIAAPPPRVCSCASEDEVIGLDTVRYALARAQARSTAMHVHVDWAALKPSTGPTTSVADTGSLQTGSGGNEGQSSEGGCSLGPAGQAPPDTSLPDQVAMVTCLNEAHTLNIDGTGAVGAGGSRAPGVDWANALQVSDKTLQVCCTE